MKKSLLYFLFILNFYSAFAQSWSQITDFPGTERDDGVVFVIGNKAYCGTGLQVGWSPTRDMFVLDLLNDSWSSISSLPLNEERQYACGFSYQNKGFIFGGINGNNHLNDIWIYDAIADSWQAGNPMPANGRGGSSVFVIQNIAYIIGGKDSLGTTLKQVWAYDCITNTWTQKNNFNANGIWRASATSLANKGYIMLGEDSANHFPTALFIYDEVNDSFSIVNNFPLSGRTYSSMISCNNRLLLLAGEDSLGSMHNDVWLFEPIDSSWTQLVSVPSNGFRGGMAFANNDAAYYVAGIDEGFTRLKKTWKATNPTALKEIKEEEFFTIYPNPVNENLFIKFNHFNGVISLYNLIGEKLFQKNISSSQQKNNLFEIDFSDYNDGIYFLQWTNGNKCFSKNIIHSK